MPERIKQIPKQILEFWNRYTSKQKTIIISVVAAIFLAIVVLSYVLSRPKYIQLQRYEDPKTVNEVVTLLEENRIKYQLSKDALTVNVDEKDYTAAQLLIGSEGLTADSGSGQDWGWALNTDMSTTSQDRKQRNILATQNEYRSNLMKIEQIKEATVVITPPKDPYSILEDEEDTAISVILTLNGEVPSEFGENIAQHLATAVGNKDTSKVSIIDSNGNILYGGDTSDGLGGANYSIEEYRQKLQNTYGSRLKQLLLKDDFDDVEVHANIKLDNDIVEELYTEYTPQEGREEGLYSHSYEYKTTSTSSGSTGEPGTGSNDATDYMMENGNQTSGQTSLNKYDYLPNELKRTIKKEKGAIIPEESSIALVLTKYTVYDEKTMKDTGQLENMTFEEFMAANNTALKQQLAAQDQQDVLNLIAMTTGIPQENIAFTVWEKPVFQSEVKEGFQFTNYLMIILAVLIIALLIFVVFKGTAPVEETEMEPELSIDKLIATTTEDQSLDDIEFSDKSETRKMIEKFVDENPEAVAQLLRNWLNEDWG